MKYRRGVRSFKNLFGEQVTEEQKKKGRDAELVAQRDECLFHRYYYYAKLHRVDFEPAMRILCEEFFLSTDTIPRIVNEYTVQLRQLMNGQPDLNYFRRKYPHLVWKQPEVPVKNTGTANR
jgi:hypothetical protein